MANCPYCGVAINAETARTAAEVQSKVGAACSNASYLKIMARAMIVFYLIGWIPFVGGVGSLGFLAMVILIPILLIRWWVKYGKLQTGDTDYEKARRDTVIAAVIWSVMLIIWVALAVIQALVFSRMS